MKKETRLVNIIKGLLRRANVPRWLHHFGPKKYEFYQHMLAFFIKQACKLSFRRVVKLLRDLGFDIPSYSALCKMRKRIPFWLWEKIFSLTVPQRSIAVAAIDSTTLSRSNPSWHYIKRIDRKKPIQCPLKLSSVIETNGKKILALRLRAKIVHDVRDVKYLFKRIMNHIDKLTGDTAYDAEWIHELAHERSMVTVIKPRKNVKRGFWRKKMKKHWRTRTYHRRSMIESTFGAYKHKYGASVLARAIDTQRAEVYCAATLHNLSLMN